MRLTKSPEQFGQDFRLTLLTTNAEEAAEANRAGIQRIGVDLETIGKKRRQSGHDTRLSYHSWEDLERIAKGINGDRLFVRINPPHRGTEQEVETALDLGVAVIMLPYFNTELEAADFARFVRGRAYTMLLVETPRSIVRICEIAAVSGVDEIMIGLNDIRLGMNLVGMEFVCSAYMSTISDVVHQARKAFSFGGLGRHDQDLPTNPDLIYAQYPRLGAQGSWLARSFFKDVPDDWTLEKGVQTLRERLSFWASKSDEELLEARRTLCRLQ
jgi:hypothetical protein